MLKVGITGGIGSGKSIVCRVFETLGIPVFDADAAARQIMNEDKEVRAAIIELLGKGAYQDGGKLDREYVATAVYGNPEKLASLNAIVHPATIAFGARWLAAQQTPYAIKEAAIFFESGSNKDMDVMIGVSAPVDLRLYRAMARANASEAKVRSIMENQMSEEEKMSLCDYVIVNNDLTPVLAQVLEIHEKLLQRSVAR